MRTFVRVLVLLLTASLLPLLAVPPSTSNTTPHTWKIESYHGHPVVASRAIVRFKSKPSASTMATLQSSTDASRFVRIGRGGWYVVDSKSKSAAQLITLLAADPAVAQAAPDEIGTLAGGWTKSALTLRRPRPFADNSPDDPGFPDEWALLNTGQTINNVTGTSGADINAEGAWSFNAGHGDVTDTPDVAIGVVDTGIDYSLSDLLPDMWSAPSPYTIDIQGNIYDCPAGSHGFSAVDYDAGCSGQATDIAPAGHGTQIASIIGAVGNNDTAMAGEAWSTQMVSIRVFDSSDETTETTVQTGIDALMQIKNHFGSQAPIGILNLSVVFTGPTPGLESTIQSAAADGIITVTGDDCGSTAEYPAYYRTTDELAVSASDQLDEPAYWGPGSCSNSGGQVAAPGKNIESIPPGGANDMGPDFNGTSASAPFATAAAAIVEAWCPLVPSAVVATLTGTADLKTNLDPIADRGQRLDLGNAIYSCLATGQTSYGRGTITVNLESSGGGSCGPPPPGGAQPDVPCYYPTSGTVSATIAGTEYQYDYDTQYDTTDSIGEGLARAINNKYLTATYAGGGVIDVRATALGEFTNYTLSVGVSGSCGGSPCAPEPTIFASGSSFTGGTGPTR